MPKGMIKSFGAPGLFFPPPCYALVITICRLSLCWCFWFHMNLYISWIQLLTVNIVSLLPITINMGVELGDPTFVFTWSRLKSFTFCSGIRTIPHTLSRGDDTSFKLVNNRLLWHMISYIFPYPYNVTTLGPSKDDVPSKSSNWFSFLKLLQLLKFIPHFSLLLIWIMTFLFSWTFLLPLPLSGRRKRLFHHSTASFFFILIVQGLF